MATSTERQRELRRLYHRKKKVTLLKQKAATASPADKARIAEKLRRLTPGAEVIIANLGLEG